MAGHHRTRIAALAIGTVLALFGAGACGGGSSSSSTPSSPSPTILPAATLCGAIGSTGPSATAIVDGVTCSTDGSSVVLVNLRDNTGQPLGACSGTVISPRAVLTAAHCLINGTAAARIFLGSGPEQVARSFSSYPGYSESDPNALDVGVVIMPADIGRASIPLLTSRDATVGEQAIFAGWGKDQNLVTATLRVGAAPITSVGSNFLQTQFSNNVSSVCQGDSGGPILLQQGGVWSIGGIISANQTTACAFGTDFYANVRNQNISSFIFNLVPDAARR